MTRKGTEADKTVIWLDGGGTCWPGRDDCAKEAQFYNWIEEHGLASSNEGNPVRTLNIIYVPYCDGSIHMGDSEADYDGDGVVDHWHWGLRTTSAAVRLMGELFPESKKILIAGCSAGGGGMIVAAPIVRLVFTEANLYELTVSGLGLVDPSRQELYKVIEETWNVGGVHSNGLFQVQGAADLHTRLAVRTGLCSEDWRLLILPGFSDKLSLGNVTRNLHVIDHQYHRGNSGRPSRHISEVLR